MPTYTIINEAGGPVRAVHVPAADEAVAQLRPGESVVDGIAPPDTYRSNGEWVSRPPLPSVYHAWTASGWLDRRPAPAIRSAKEGEARQKRDRLLNESDWVVLRALDQGEAVPPAWSVYRRALRSLPDQPGFPETIVWPTRPQGE